MPHRRRSIVFTLATLAVGAAGAFAVQPADEPPRAVHLASAESSANGEGALYLPWLGNGEPPAVTVRSVAQLGGLFWDAVIDGDTIYAGMGPHLASLREDEAGRLDLLGRSEMLRANLFGLDRAGGLVYAAGGSEGLVVFDVSDPSRPRVVSRTRLRGPAIDVAVGGDLAYVAAGGAGLSILDVSDPAAPREIGSLFGPQVARRLAVGGGFAYVLGQLEGSIWVIDVRDPRRPSAVPRILDQAYDLVLSGPHLYVSGIEGLLVYDVTDPARPTKLGGESFALPGALAIDGDVVFQAYFGDLWAYDVSDPTAPSRIAEINLELDPQTETAGIVAQNGRLVVAATSPEAFARPERPDLVGFGVNLVALDASDPTAITSTARLPWTPALEGSCAQQEAIAFCTTSYGLEVLDLSDTRRAQSLVSSAGRMSLPLASPPVLSANYLFGLVFGAAGAPGTRARKLVVADVTRPDRPQPVAELELPPETGPYGRALSLDGSMLYVSEGGLRRIDVSDPAHPVDDGPIAGLEEVRSYVVTAGHAFVLEDRQLRIASLEGSQAVTVARVPVQAAHDASGPGLVLAGPDHVFVATAYGGLDVIDVSDPTEATVVGRVPDDALSEPRWPLTSIFLGAGFLITTGSDVQVFDVTDVEHPSLVLRYQGPDSVRAARAIVSGAAWRAPYLYASYERGDLDYVVGPFALEIRRHGVASVGTRSTAVQRGGR